MEILSGNRYFIPFSGKYFILETGGSTLIELPLRRSIQRLNIYWAM